MKNMRKISAIISSLAIAAIAFVGCQQVEENAPASKKITLNFAAETVDPTASKATLTPNEGETAFAAAWEANDKIGITAYWGEDIYKDNVEGTWNNGSFKTSFEGTDGETFSFVGVYPFNENSEIEFGGSRVQDGNNFNGDYDIMLSDRVDAVLEENATITLPMHRQSAIAYFHLTGTPAANETVQSATLTIDAEESTPAKIAGTVIYGDGEIITEGTTNSITVTFAEGTNPSADDFTLWFNVLPVSYKTLKLEVTTENYTLTINNSNAGSYAAGKLYKVSADVPTTMWTAKAAPSGSYTIRFNSTVKSPASISEATKPGTFVTEGAEYVSSFSDASNAFYGGTSDGLPLRVGKASEEGSITINLSNEGTVNATSIVLNAKQYSTGKDKKIGVNESDMQQPGDDYTELTYELDGSELTSITLNTSGYIYIESITVNYGGTVKTALAAPANLTVVASTKTISWDAVENAGSYNVGIGTNGPVSVTTNSYDASSIEDEYYNVSVVAVPTDTDTYKNSAAATLTDACFGTPTLSAPSLTTGTVDESNITVKWTNDSRATNGYTLNIYKKVDGNWTILDKEKTNVTSATATFSDLEEQSIYKVVAFAQAITSGDKPYARSVDAESEEITTQASKHIEDINNTTTSYTIKSLTVVAVPNTSNAIVKDDTGYLLIYKASHGLKVGNIITATGKAQQYHGVWEMTSFEITNSAEATVNHGTATEFATLTNYATQTEIRYIHALGLQNDKTITTSPCNLNLSASNTATNNKYVEVYGYVYGYYSSSASFVATSIVEDPNALTLSLDNTSKTWAYNETEAFNVNVTTNGEWTISPETIDWATISVDGNVITITPNGANETNANYSSEITVTASKTGYANKTAKITLTQNIQPTCQAPEITCVNNKVTITAEEGATILYSVDGSDPSLTYTAPFDITETVTVKAIAAREGYKNSTLASKECTYVDPSSKKTYSFTITTDDFNGTSYAANDGEKESTAIAAEDGSVMTVKWTSSNVMLGNKMIQGKKSTGKITNVTDLGNVKTISINDNKGYSYQINGGNFTISAGTSASYASSITITFEN